ncbi:MAG TPA: LCP family protein [Candidatus Saccharimonadales bacterium]|nr:LCP family protein [Candidatus Saccharimonadales bacterium]
MKPQRHSIDGFVPRRAGSRLGEQRPTPAGDLRRRRVPSQSSAGLDESMRRTIRSKNPHTQQGAAPLGYSERGVLRRDIDESLSGIPDTTYEAPKKRRWPFGKKKIQAGRPKNRRVVKWMIIAVVVILAGVGGWLAYKTFSASNNIFKGNIFGLVQNQPLKQDSNGRSNILVLGTSEDDPGHGGAYLTDSMMVVSIDQKNKTASMFSIPRDLYVKYGMACNSGYQGKINEYFNCVNEDYTTAEAEQERLTKTREFVGEIFGMDIQYGVHVNNTVIKDAVNAVGGVDVDIQGSNGDPGVLDRNFDWRCSYRCHLVKYDNGIHHLDGEHALFLAMARGDIAPTYGLGNSNFDREKNQQKIIVALKEKAVSTGTLTDLGKVTGLIDSLGNNLRTNFETSEIRTLMALGSDIPSTSIKAISLYGGDDAVFASGPYNGASVVMPAAGIFDYSGIRTFLKQKLSTDPVTREGANIVVLNGSGVTGVAQTEADKLTDAGFIVTGVDNAPEGTYAEVEVYQIGDGMAGTKQRLESAFGVKAKKTVPPITVAEGVNFVVIFGVDRSSN